MAATPYQVVLKGITRSGKGFMIPVTASDVAAGFWLTPDGSGEIVLGNEPVTITDITCTAAGVDTPYVLIFQNGVDTGIKVFTGLCLGSNLSRQFMREGNMVIPAGAKLKFKQSAT